MYRWALTLHSAWRWVVILVGLAVLAAACDGLIRRKPWAPTTARLGRLFGVAVDIQVLMGAILYVSLSPLTVGGLNVPGAAPAASELRFFSIVHPLLMATTLFAVHFSEALVRRGQGDAARQRRALIFYGVTLMLVLTGVPWWRPWFRM